MNNKWVKIACDMMTSITWRNRYIFEHILRSCHLATFYAQLRRGTFSIRALAHAAGNAHWDFGNHFWPQLMIFRLNFTKKNGYHKWLIDEDPKTGSTNSGTFVEKSRNLSTAEFFLPEQSQLSLATTFSFFFRNFRVTRFCYILCFCLKLGKKWW